MYVKKDMDFNTLMEECWCCEDVLNRIDDEDKIDEFMDLLEECFYENVPTMTELNDLIRFDWEWIFEQLGIEDEEDDEELDDD